MPTGNSITVSSFWHGAPLPLHCRLCIKSFIDHGVRFALYCYEDVEVPSGVELRDAATILPATRIFHYQTGPGAGSIAAFANVFRYKLLTDHGGWWVDTDVLCLRPELPPEDIVFAWETPGVLGNAVLKFPANHILMERLYRTAEMIVDARGPLLEWGEIGPALLTRVMTEGNALHAAIDSSKFYPIGYSESALVLCPEQAEHVKQRSKESLLLHLWNEMFRREGVDSMAFPPPDSYLAKMFARHDVGALAASK